MHYPEIDPIALQLGFLKIHWYGLMYLFGLAGAWYLAKKRIQNPIYSDWTEKQIDDLIYYGAIGIVLGGRIGYLLFYHFQDWLNDPLRLFRIWEGGMSFHGGLIGVLIALFFFSRKYQRPYFVTTDFVAPLVPIGLFFGRIGNFINGELWGKPTDLPWGMQINCQQLAYECYVKLGLPWGTEWSPPLHPNPIYEALSEGLLLFIILWGFSAQARPTRAISGLFLFGYGIIRFLIEFERLPDANIGYLYGNWLSMGQVLSLPMILAGIYLFYLAYRRHA